MQNISSVKELIDQWSKRADFAAAIGQNLATVHKWAQFNRIPSEHQAGVVRAAQDKGLTQITADWMIEYHSAPKRGAA